MPATANQRYYQLLRSPAMLGTDGCRAMVGTDGCGTDGCRADLVDCFSNRSMVISPAVGPWTRPLERPGVPWSPLELPGVQFCSTVKAIQHHSPTQGLQCTAAACCGGRCMPLHIAHPTLACTSASQNPKHYSLLQILKDIKFVLRYCAIDWDRGLGHGGFAIIWG